MIKIKNVTKKYNNITVLNNINFNIYKGDKIALVGANGAGKTTLIEIMLGITNSNHGSVSWDFDYKKSPLEKIGVQFQDASYPPNLLASEIIEFFIDVSNEKISQKVFDDMVEAFGIKDFISQQASSLSGGQKQRLNIFLALVSNPKIILLDELTTGLDIKSSQEITTYISKYLLKEKKTMLIVSHNAYEVTNVCSRIIVMQLGNVMYDNTIAHAIKKFGSIGKLMTKYI